MHLNQLIYLSKEIDILKEQIAKIENQVVTDVIIGSDVEFPYLVHKQYITGINDDKVGRLKRKLSCRLKELIAAQEKMLDYICRVEDSEMRQILTLRYIDGLTWRQVAFKMGRAGDGSTERKKHDRFLKISRVS